MFKKAKKGFTIVELVIVIAVIGILSAILIPTFANLTTQANETALKSNLASAYSVYASEAGDLEIGYKTVEEATIVDKKASITFVEQKNAFLVPKAKEQGETVTSLAGYIFNQDKGGWQTKETDPKTKGDASGNIKLVVTADSAISATKAVELSTFGDYVVYLIVE